MTNSASPRDSVLHRRAQYQFFVRVGKAVGYTLFLGACIIFAATRVDGPRPIYNQLLGLSMGIGSLFLAPAIVFGYAVKAAQRDDNARAAAAIAKRAEQPQVGD